MAWTAPTTRSTGDLITASVWNTDLVNNLAYLKNAPTFDGAVTVTGTLTVNGAGTHTFTAATSAGNAVAVINTTSGTGAYGNLTVTAGTSNFYIDNFSQGYTTSGTAIAASTRLYADSAGGLSLVAANAAGAIRFYSGGTTERMRIYPSGGIYVGDFASSVDPGSDWLGVKNLDILRTAAGFGSAGTLTNAPSAGNPLWVAIRVNGVSKQFPVW